MILFHHFNKSEHFVGKMLVLIGHIVLGFEIFAPELIYLKAAFVNIKTDIAFFKKQSSGYCVCNNPNSRGIAIKYIFTQMPYVPVSGSLKMPISGVRKVNRMNSKAIAESTAHASFGDLHGR